MHLSVAGELDDASDFGFLLILLSVFPEAIGIPGLSDVIGLDAAEELVAIKEDRFIAASRNLDTTCFFDHFVLVSDFCQLSCRYFSNFPILFPPLPFASGIFDA